MGILDLPEELQDLCCEVLSDREALKNLRLVNRRWLKSASKLLFKEVCLELSWKSSESSERCIRILQTDRLRLLVRELCLDLCGEQIVKQLPPSFGIALRNLGKFSNLQRLSLCFDAEVRSPARPLMYDIEHDFRFRKFILESLAEAFDSQDHSGSRLESISIRNLQGVVDREAEFSSTFRPLLERLRSLSLLIATEFKEDSTEASISFDDAHPFFETDLKSVWLHPVQGHLTQLRLFTDGQYWGHFPLCDLRDVHFPRLRSLTLARFTFVCDSQLEWIFSHRATLSRLILDDCPIIPAGRSSTMTPKFGDRSNLEIDIENATWTYHVRWYDYLRLIRDKLSLLTHFGWDYGLWEVDEQFETSDELLACVRPGRYKIYDGNTDGVWIKHFNSYADDLRDQEALNDLMDTIRVRNLGLRPYRTHDDNHH